MTLSFHKVMFGAQEVLDIADDANNLLDFKYLFVEAVEKRSREHGPAVDSGTSAQG